MLSYPSSTYSLLTTIGKGLLAKDVVQVARGSRHLPIWVRTEPVSLPDTCLCQVPERCQPFLGWDSGVFPC